MKKTKASPVKKEAVREGPVSVAAEIGSTGLKRWGGMITEEFLHELRGIKGVRTYQEMSDNDATVGGIIFAIKMLVRQVEWDVEAFSEDPADQEAQKFVESCLDDMARPWSDTIAEIFSMLVYGWSYHEIVLKYRRGYMMSREFSSKHNDGRLGWRKFAIRAQDTLVRWDYSEDGTLMAMVQQAPPTFEVKEIPLSKSLLFRTDTHKDNPEGRSILRTSYRSWYMKRHIENTEAIGVERDLAGLPVMRIPSHIMAADASDTDKAIFEDYKKIITGLKRDEQEGVILPSDRDENGNFEYDLTLLTSGGTRNFRTTEIINRYKQDIAQSVLADFILIGHAGVGSYALTSSKTELFTVALGAFLKLVAEEINDKAIPDLLRVNGMDPSRSPKLVHGDLETLDLGVLGTFLQALSASGVPLFPNPDLEKWLMEQAGMPVSQNHGLPVTPGARPGDALAKPGDRLAKPGDRLAAGAKKPGDGLAAPKKPGDGLAGGGGRPGDGLVDDDEEDDDELDLPKDGQG